MCFVPTLPCFFFIFILVDISKQLKTLHTRQRCLKEIFDNMNFVEVLIQL